MVRRLLLIFFVCLGLGACSRQQSATPKQPEDRLALADDLKARGDYIKAIAQYEQLLSEFPAQEVAERARFNLATARMGIEQYDLARSDFEDFIDSYPRSDLVDDAMYMIALSYVEEAPRPERDQTKTVKALDELNLLLREYPDTELKGEVEARIDECRSRLAEKDYLSGALYLRLGSYKAAHVYFDSVVAEYGDTPWAAHALVGKAKVCIKQKKFDEAREILEQVIEAFPETPMSREAAQRLKGLVYAPETEEQTSSE
jgi:outer membrane protein assembly factor BamD